MVNLQRVEQVLDNADKPQQMEEEVLFYPLKNMQARELQSRLQSLLLSQGSALSKYFLNNTTIEADERTNQLIVLTHPTNVPMLDTIIESFDIDVEPQTSSEVFYIKHAQAVEVQTLLDAVVSGQQEARDDEPENAVGVNQPPQQGGGGNTPSQPTTPPASLAQTVENLDTDNLQFSQYITIVADERSNAVVVYGTKSDIKQISDLIDKIDVVLAQVMVEVIIAEVTLSKDEVSGLSSLGLTRDGTWGGLEIKTKTPSIGDTAAFDITATADLKKFSVVFGPALSSGKLRVLQAPVLATTHNQEASINVSESRPFVTGSTTSQINPDATTKHRSISRRWHPAHGQAAHRVQWGGPDGDRPDGGELSASERRDQRRAPVQYCCARGHFLRQRDRPADYRSCRFAGVQHQPQRQHRFSCLGISRCSGSCLSLRRIKTAAAS